MAQQPTDNLKAATEPTEDKEFYFEDIIFLVEDRYFKVPRYHFENDSQVFRDMFSMPQGEGTAKDGSSKENPLRLDGIKASGFRQLLRILCPPSVGKPTPLTVDQWISAIRLAKFYDMKNLLEYAKTRHNLLALPPEDKVALGRELDVTKWVIDGLDELACQSDPMNKRHVDRLGIRTVLMLCALREGELDTGTINHGPMVNMRSQKRRGVYRTAIMKAFELAEEVPISPKRTKSRPSSVARNRSTS